MNYQTHVSSRICMSVCRLKQKILHKSLLSVKISAQLIDKCEKAIQMIC